MSYAIDVYLCENNAYRIITQIYEEIFKYIIKNEGIIFENIKITYSPWRSCSDYAVELCLQEEEHSYHYMLIRYRYRGSEGTKEFLKNKSYIQKNFNIIFNKIYNLFNHGFRHNVKGVTQYNIEFCDHCNLFYNKNDIICSCKKEPVIDFCDKEGYTYFIRAKDKVKIGCVVGKQPICVQNRYKAIRCGIPFEESEIELLFYEEGGYKRENQLHKIFAKYRIRKSGEWFHYSEEIQKYIEKQKLSEKYLKDGNTK